MSTNAPSSAPSHPGFAIGALVALIALCALLHQCHQPPPPKAADAPADQFSAKRALKKMEVLLGDHPEKPHPLGTVANEQIANRLINELSALGLDPQAHRRPVNVLRPGETELALAHNITATLPSSNPEAKAIVLACHYDSVGAGPGISDDLAAVGALLEVARILQDEGPLDRPVILLFTDGEELGLIGAQGFVAQNKLAKNIGIILNVEARGSGGGSLMFETSKRNEWMIAQAARGLSRPMSSSAYVEVYRRMPNSSDLTVFMHRKLAGMNFAYIGNPKHYHTPLDDLEHLDQRSLQHHGENALGMVRQLLESELEENQDSKGDAVYTDLFGRFLIWWPASWGLFLSLVILIGLIFLLWTDSDETGISQLFKTLPCWIVVHLAAVALPALFYLLFRKISPAQTQFPAGLSADTLFIVGLTVIGALTPLTLFKRTSPQLFFRLHILILTLTGLALSVTITGFSYLWLLPAALGTLLLLGLSRLKPTSPHFFLAALLLSVATAVPAYPLLMRFPMALGAIPIIAPLLGALIVLVILPLIPLFLGMERRIHLVLLAVIGVFTGYFVIRSATTPSFTPDSPRHLNFVFAERGGTGAATLSVYSPSFDHFDPDAVAKDLRLADLSRSLLRLPGLSYEIRPAHESPPNLSLLNWTNEGDSATATLIFHPSMLDQHVLVGIPNTLKLSALQSGEQPLKLPIDSRDGHHWIRLRGGVNPMDTSKMNSLPLEITWKNSRDLPLLVIGVSPGLPSHLKSFGDIRTAYDGCAAHGGDLTYNYQLVVLRDPSLTPE